MMEDFMKLVNSWKLLIHFIPPVSFDTPKKHFVFLCFQGVSKDTSGVKRVNYFFEKLN